MTGSERASNSARLPAIDALRGVAALAVVTAHLPFSWNPLATRIDQAVLIPALPLWLTGITDYGRFGVDLFLVISGFCIHLGVARGGTAMGVDFVRFWRRRLTRLYPPYVVAVAASVLGLLFLFALVGGNRVFPRTLGYESTSLFLIDVVRLLTLTQDIDVSSRIGNAPFWTLALEEQLYFLYFALLIMRRRLGWGINLAVISAVTVAWRAAPLVVPSLGSTSWNLLGPARWIEWALGALAVDAYFGVVSLPNWTRRFPVALALLGVAVAVNVPALITASPVLTLLSDAAFGVAFFALVSCACAARGLTRSLLFHRIAGVGLFSYSLYLTHLPVMVAAKQVALRIGLAPGDAQTVLMLVLRLGSALVVGYIFYRVIEIRALRASRKLRAPDGPSPAVAAG